MLTLLFLIKDKKKRLSFSLFLSFIIGFASLIKCRGDADENLALSKLERIENV